MCYLHYSIVLCQEQKDKYDFGHPCELICNKYDLYLLHSGFGQAIFIGSYISGRIISYVVYFFLMLLFTLI